jgi:hypothetical protein
MIRLPVPTTQGAASSPIFDDSDWEHVLEVS